MEEGRVCLVVVNLRAMGGLVSCCCCSLIASYVGSVGLGLTQGDGLVRFEDVNCSALLRPHLSGLAVRRG